MVQVIWRPVVGYEDLYVVSNDGQVRSLDTYINCGNGAKRLHKGKTKPQRANNRGYVTVTLCRDGRCINTLVHRLVAEAFVPNMDKKPQVNHIDGDQTNNHFSNLEWVTDDENKKHSAITNGGTQRPKKPVIVRDIKTGVEYIFEGLRVAERCLKLDHKSALNVLKGRQHKTKGFVLHYV